MITGSEAWRSRKSSVSFQAPDYFASLRRDTIASHREAQTSKAVNCLGNLGKWRKEFKLCRTNSSVCTFCANALILWLLLQVTLPEFASKAEHTFLIATVLKIMLLASLFPKDFIFKPLGTPSPGCHWGSVLTTIKGFNNEVGFYYVEFTVLRGKVQKAKLRLSVASL